MTPADFERSFGILPEPMLLATPGGVIMAANTAASALIGHKAADISGVALRELASDSPEKLARLLRLFGRSGNFVPGALELRNGGSGGVACRVEGCLIRSYDAPALLLRLQPREQAVTRFLNLNDRITTLNHEILERTRAERALDAQKEWLRTTLASIGDGVIATDASGAVAFMNLVAESLTGWRAEEAAGLPLDRIFQIINDHAQQPVEDDGLANHAVLVARDGTKRPIAESAAPIYDAGGQKLGTVMVFRDVTQHRKDELMIQETNKSLQKSNESLRQFAYAIAHDLKEPMRMVSLYCQLLSKTYAGNLGGEGEMFLRQAIGGASRMEDLLEGLLAFITAGDLMTQTLENIDLDEVVAKAVLNLQSVIEETGASVTWDPLPSLQGHPVPLVDVFQNLIANAIKYRREDEPPRVHITAQRREHDWLFAVKDNGIGIEPEYHRRIFGVFKRLHPDRYPGTGIGLALCAQIVEGRGGAIWVESEPGKGSRFCLTIPD